MSKSLSLDALGALLSESYKLRFCENITCSDIPDMRVLNAALSFGKFIFYN